jgi:hypothetical protein
VQALEPDLSLLREAAAALADMECEVLDVVPTVGDTELHFQAVVQVRAASGKRVARSCELTVYCMCGWRCWMWSLLSAIQSCTSRLWCR